jgi:hypothetical protein
MTAARPLTNVLTRSRHQYSTILPVSSARVDTGRNRGM